MSIKFIIKIELQHFEMHLKYFFLFLFFWSYTSKAFNDHTWKCVINGQVDLMPVYTSGNWARTADSGTKRKGHISAEDLAMYRGTLPKDNDATR